MPGQQNRFADARRRMIELDLKGRDITDPAVLKVMAQTPREEFVPKKYISHAYADGPLPIGMGQTISQPYIVALMTQHLRLNEHCEVLEIGTGSGYQTAILSKLAKEIYTIERFSELAESAQSAIERLGIKNVKFYVGDGSCGWPDERTFDRIIVTAALPKVVPQVLLNQLKQGGLVVAPVGGDWVQDLVAFEKTRTTIIERQICEVRFVKLVGEHGFAQ